LSHASSILEVTGKVVHAFFPSLHHNSAETTARLDFRNAALPLFHTGLELGIVHKTQMLIQMILPIKGPLLKRLLLAADVIVGFKMIPVWISCGAEYTTKYTVLLRYTTKRRTCPLVQDQVHGFLMALPVIFGDE
jgi:hypothetical protein